MSYLQLGNTDIFISVFPKCGCNFIRTFIYNISPQGADSKWKLSTLKKKDLEQKKSNAFIINILRDPWSRFASAYCSKVINPPKKIIPRVENYLQRIGHTIDSVSFDDFCDGMLINQDLFFDLIGKDGHFKPLVKMLANRRINCLTIETKDLNSDMIPLAIKSKTGIDYSDIYLRSKVKYRSQHAMPTTNSISQMSANELRTLLGNDRASAKYFSGNRLDLIVKTFYAEDKKLFQYS